MKLDDILKFKGDPRDLNKYQGLLDTQAKLNIKLRQVSNALYDVEDSLSVFCGELTESDKKLADKFRSHQATLQMKQQDLIHKLDEVNDNLKKYMR